MNSHQIIIFSFLAVVVLIIFSGYLVKIYRNKKKKTTGPSKARKIDFELKGDIFELGKLAIILDDLERYQVPLKTILELNIIIEEVFSSIVSRLKENQKDRTVYITLMLENNQIMVSIKDQNDEFDPTVIPKIDLNAPIEEISFHGLGFHLVRNLADQLSYQRLEGQNLLTLKKTYKF
jgi:anti-sigma regulatory factor (Ser/Thr protein kinase)